MKIYVRVLVLLGILAGVPVQAEELVSASFASGSEQESLTGINPEDSALKPDGANVTGESWVIAGGGGFDVWSRDNAARMHNGGAVGISLGDRAARAAVTISADITFEHPASENAEGEPPTVDKTALQSGFALLGFYSAIPKQQFGNAYKDFTGLQLNYDGSLQVIVAGEKSGSPIAFGGDFDPAAPHVLTYSIDTVTGAITKVSLSDSAAKYDFSGAPFSGSVAAFAGFGGSMGNQPLYVEFRSFSVSAEPR